MRLLYFAGLLFALLAPLSVRSAPVDPPVKNPQAAMTTCAERDILLELYNATNALGWTTSTGWEDGADDPTCSYCDWYGITCNAAGRVIGIDLDGAPDGLNSGGMGNNLFGSLPSSIVGLTELEWLFLKSDPISGQLPNDIGQLSNLRRLALVGLLIDGAIPESMGDLFNLERLQIDLTELSGGIPASFGNLTNLEWLRVRENRNLTGTLPAEMANLTSLIRLQMENNAFTGPLPTGLGDLVINGALQHVYLNGNNFSDCFPADYLSICGLGQSNTSQVPGYDFRNNPNLPGNGDLFGTVCSAETGICFSCEDYGVTMSLDEVEACVGEQTELIFTITNGQPADYVIRYRRNGAIQTAVSTNGTTSTSVVVTAPTGTATFSLVSAIEENDCEAASLGPNISLNGIPSGLPTFNLPSFLCPNQSAFPLPTTATNGISGSWELDESPISSLDAASLPPGLVTLTFIPDNNICAETTFFEILIADEAACDPNSNACATGDCGSMIDLNLSADSDTLCSGEELVVSNFSDAGFEFFVVDWGDGTVDTVNDYQELLHTYPDLDACTNAPFVDYSVQIKGYEVCAELRCVITEFPVTVLTPVDADFIMPASVCASDVVAFDNLSCNATRYLWDFGDGTTTTEALPSHQFAPGTYTVQLTVENDCSMATIAIDITVTATGEGCVNTCEDALDCADDLVFSINDACTDTLTISDFLVGEWGCLTEDDLYFVLADQDVSNGPVLDGTGDFFFFVHCIGPNCATANFNGCGGIVTVRSEVEPVVDYCPRDTVILLPEEQETLLFNPEEPIFSFCGPLNISYQVRASNGSLLLEGEGRIDSLVVGSDTLSITFGATDLGGEYFVSCTYLVQPIPTPPTEADFAFFFARNLPDCEQSNGSIITTYQGVNNLDLYTFNWSDGANE
ncbi:MAG: PKD domain-containing protein, partial [Bacteroidota bacterium]